MGAISDWINMGSLHRLRAWLLAMAVALLVSQLLQAIGWIDLSIDQFWDWWAYCWWISVWRWHDAGWGLWSENTGPVPVAEI